MHSSIAATKPVTPVFENPSNEISIPAGFCIIDNNNIVSPQPSKGILKISQEDSSDLKIIEWISNKTRNHEINFSANSTKKLQKLVQLQNVKIYYLAVASQNYFFWLQDVDDQSEKSLISSFNEILAKSPPKPITNEVSLSSTKDDNKDESTNADEKMKDVSTENLKSENDNISNENTKTEQLTAPSSSNNGVNNNNTNQYTNTSPYLSNVPELFQYLDRPIKPTQLKSILCSPSSINILLSDDEAKAELLSFLPPELQTEENLTEIFRNPQFHSCLETLTQAIYSDQLPILAASIGIPTSDITSHFMMDPMQQIINGLERVCASNSSTPQNEEEKKKNSSSSDSQQNETKKDDSS